MIWNCKTPKTVVTENEPERKNKNVCAPKPLGMRGFTGQLPCCAGFFLHFFFFSESKGQRGIFKEKERIDHAAISRGSARKDIKKREFNLKITF